MKKRTFSLSQNQIAALQKLAEKSGLVISEHVRRALDAYSSHGKRATYDDRQQICLVCHWTRPGVSNYEVT
jgi:hypothetical protein